FGVVVTLLLFVCVVLHELAHSLVAMGFGTKVKEIVLLPLGGVARMEGMPERPYQELLMALAGPVTSGLIGMALAMLTLLALPLRVWLDFGRALAVTGRLEWVYMLPYLVTTNLFLAGFNLIPAFPMDGGRVLRALLAAVIPYGRATAIAVAVGQALAWLIGLVGLLGRNVLVMLVALFVYVGAAQEGRMVQVKVALAGLRVRQAFSRRARPVHPDDLLGHAVDLTLEGFQSDFPVCDGERLVGMLTRTDVLVGLKEHGPGVPIRQVMRQQFPVAQMEDDLFEIQQQMAAAGLAVVPVVEGESFLGLLTRQDLEEVYRMVSVHPGLLRPGRTND
ncbi:MAG TPA: CBS domain-containing protein, partial [Anaerolineae bacterium]|nr:CBS domain-containing protein [Anaerolineae bacterium]